MDCPNKGKVGHGECEVGKITLCEAAGGGSIAQCGQFAARPLSLKLMLSGVFGKETWVMIIIYYVRGIISCM